jgi:hypothetical protein
VIKPAKPIFFLHNQWGLSNNAEFYAYSKLVEMDSKKCAGRQLKDSSKTMRILSFSDFALFVNAFAYNF